MIQSLILALLTAVISFEANADIASSKGLPRDPLPSGCERFYGTTTFLFQGAPDRKPKTAPFPDSTELLGCKDQTSDKKYFRFRLIVGVSGERAKYGIFDAQVGDEIILPWRDESTYTLRGEYFYYCSVKDGKNSPSEIGPFAIGTPVEQPNGETLTKDILIAWRVDIPTRRIIIIPSNIVTCIRPYVPP